MRSSGGGGGQGEEAARALRFGVVANSLDLLVVSSLEETRVRGIWYIERHGDVSDAALFPGAFCAADDP